jgi:hypothetical protein
MYPTEDEDDFEECGCDKFYTPCKSCQKFLDKDKELQDLVDDMLEREYLGG